MVRCVRTVLSNNHLGIVFFLLPAALYLFTQDVVWQIVFMFSMRTRSKSSVIFIILHYNLCSCRCLHIIGFETIPNWVFINILSSSCFLRSINNSYSFYADFCFNNLKLSQPYNVSCISQGTCFQGWQGRRLWKTRRCSTVASVVYQALTNRIVCDERRVPRPRWCDSPPARNFCSLYIYSIHMYIIIYV